MVFCPTTAGLLRWKMVESCDGKPVRTPAGYARLDTVPELFAYVQDAIRSPIPARPANVC